MIQTKNTRISKYNFVFVLRQLIFEFVSNFEIGISDFTSATTVNHPSGLDLSRVSLDPNFYFSVIVSSILCPKCRPAASVATRT